MQNFFLNGNAMQIYRVFFIHLDAGAKQQQTQCRKTELGLFIPNKQ